MCLKTPNCWRKTVFPQINKVVRKLKEKGIDLGENIYTVEKAKNAVLNYIKGERNA